MKEIILSKNYGLCSGVKRSIVLVEKELIHTKFGIYAFGELLHNQKEMQRLQEKGLKVVNDFSNIKDIKDNIIIVVRTHGIEKNLLDEMLAMQNISVIDGTCPVVKKNQKIVQKYSNEGYNIIVYGDDKHPEIRALKSYIDVNTEYYIINSKLDIESFELDKDNKTIIIAQTTKNYEEYEEIIKLVKQKIKNLKVFRTICKETIIREKEAERLAKEVDFLIVIGGKNSSNTKKLANIAKLYNKNVEIVNDNEDLLEKNFSNFNRIGIISGCSTPRWLVEDIYKFVKNL
ncbi:MAG: 4-hydroxy-3-methylbut-2-enyl diphosphate reductase [Endomicrobia bacterium]|nr:4-hydroxy-3-methylbut-2-enyl diphosphate reductase [Endomicrobiia bacterium]